MINKNQVMNIIKKITPQRLFSSINKHKRDSRRSLVKPTIEEKNIGNWHVTYLGHTLSEYVLISLFSESLG